MNVREQHRRFTHDVLMRLALEEPERLVRNLRRSGVKYLKALWDACGSADASADRIESAGLGVHEHAYSDTSSIFVIAVPEAVATTGAMMVGIVMTGIGMGERGPAARYFVLEKSIGGESGWETVLAELTEEGNRRNYGEGCEASENALIGRVADVLMRDPTPGPRPN